MALNTEHYRKEVIRASADEPVSEVAELMQRKSVGCVVVMTEDDRPLGVVTDRDIALRVLRDELDPDAVPVWDIIGRNPVVVHANMPLGVVPKMMRRLSIRRIPVVDDHECLVGVITADDVLRLLAREVTMVGEALASQAAAEDLRGLQESGASGDAPSEG